MEGSILIYNGACTMDNSGTCPTGRICAHKHQIIRPENVANNFVIPVHAPTSDYIVQATILLVTTKYERMFYWCLS